MLLVSIANPVFTDGRIKELMRLLISTITYKQQKDSLAPSTFSAEGQSRLSGSGTGASCASHWHLYMLAHNGTVWPYARKMAAFCYRYCRSFVLEGKVPFQLCMVRILVECLCANATDWELLCRLGHILQQSIMLAKKLCKTDPKFSLQKQMVFESLNFFNENTQKYCNTTGRGMSPSTDQKLYW